MKFENNALLLGCGLAFSVFAAPIRAEDRCAELISDPVAAAVCSCQLIQNDVARLACYDDAAVANLIDRAIARQTVLRLSDLPEGRDALLQWVNENAEALDLLDD